jgi:hypothetical protein
MAEGVFIMVKGQADLFEVVQAFRSVGRFAHLLHGREQQAGKNADDGENH